MYVSAAETVVLHSAWLVHTEISHNYSAWRAKHSFITHIMTPGLYPRSALGRKEVAECHRRGSKSIQPKISDIVLIVLLSQPYQNMSSSSLMCDQWTFLLLLKQTQGHLFLLHLPLSKRVITWSSSIFPSDFQIKRFPLFHLGHWRGKHFSNTLNCSAPGYRETYTSLYSVTLFQCRAISVLSKAV